jgi:hypothetical protein
MLKLLSDKEVASVGIAETVNRLGDGDEYVDLGHLELGVRRASRKAPSMRRVLPRKNVQEATWAKIVEQLDALARANMN